VDIRKPKAIWWFQEGRIAGMGKPGFNQAHWTDFPLEEAVVFSWLGQHLHLAPDTPLRELWAYIAQFGPKVAPFYGLTNQQVEDTLAPLHEHDHLLNIIDRINKRANIIEPDRHIFQQHGEAYLHCLFHQEQLQHELDWLRAQGIHTLISLMEEPPNQAVTQTDIDVHHIPITDLTPPTHQQVQHFMELIDTSHSQGHAVAVHCFAGVGRTTTMLGASHLMRGGSLDGLIEIIETNNPHYQRKGRQWAYLCELHDGFETNRK
jgi:protein tyrosine phosphatase (PTP) superfamily phosphohydrolase (DUF442 family)